MHGLRQWNGEVCHAQYSKAPVGKYPAQKGRICGHHHSHGGHHALLCDHRQQRPQSLGAAHGGLHRTGRFKQYIFRAEPEWLGDLKRHGVTHLNLANNHSIDQGRIGLMDTRENIIKAGMTPVGAGQNQEEADEPVLLTDSPRSVWLIASLQLALENFSRLPDQPCVSQQTIETLCQRIAQLKQADPKCFIIVSLHWGWENHLEVVPRQRYEARQLIDAGADCLVCHHTHTLQPGETYQGKPIFYSLGNFIFDPRNDLNRQGAMVRLTITEQEATAEELPIVIRQCTPYLKK